MEGPRVFSGLQVTGMHDRRIFLDCGIFLEGKLGNYSFGWLDLSKDFFGYL